MEPDAFCFAKRCLTTVTEETWNRLRGPSVNALTDGTA